jgi:hypothetical protein
MTAQLNQPVRSSVTSRFTKIVALFALIFVAHDSARAINMTVGAEQVIYTRATLKKKSLNTWPDGSFGVLSNGNGTYNFYGANGGVPTMTTGTLLDPGHSKKKTINITGIPSKTYNYVSGGPVYRDPVSGERLMIYHAEKWGNSAQDFHSMLGIAVATDPSSLNFRDLGTIIEPNAQTGFAEVGGGSFAVVGDYLNVYYRDSLATGGTSELAVARASMFDLLNNAWKGISTPFTKYYNGSWSQPGRGGLSSPLEVGNPSNSWSSVSYNDYLNQLVMVTSQYETGGGNLYLSTSADGVNWAPRQAVALDAGEQFYPSLIGTGADPQHTGQSFYVYYTDSQKGAFDRWKDAQLVRRSITINSLAPAPVVIPPVTIPPVQPTAGDWAQIADYQASFKGVKPATGWLYAWDPTGKLGNAANYVPLLWSSSLNIYNTTGGATQAPGKSTHNDDYMQLAYNGGHPGKPGFDPIIGYQIQASDGSGQYRLAGTSIRKTDGKVTGNEDGLSVLVYINNTKLGSGFNVSTNGQWSIFDGSLGKLNVGDTVWIMFDALKNQNYDAFTDFDFALQRFVPSVTLAAQAVGVPEPSSMSLLFVAMAGCTLWLNARRSLKG